MRTFCKALPELFFLSSSLNQFLDTRHDELLLFLLKEKKGLLQILHLSLLNRYSNAAEMVLLQPTSWIALEMKVFRSFRLIGKEIDIEGYREQETKKRKRETGKALRRRYWKSSFNFSKRKLKICSCNNLQCVELLFSWEFPLSILSILLKKSSFKVKVTIKLEIVAIFQRIKAKVRKF